MTVYVFTGPTIAPNDAAEHLDAVYLPPVSQGDVYRVSQRQPDAIGIIDGFFECVPAVWHKEILWAMSHGIHVFGSASMGALRAAELEMFGMEGVGVVFEAFRDGRLTDDDEVAVVHAPEEFGYRPLSEAMVNIRATLAAATAADVISADTARTMTELAKGLFYPERNYDVVLHEACSRGVSAAEVQALRDWLPTGRVDQKRVDALAMLRLMRERLECGQESKEVTFQFEYTDMWDQARASAGELRDQESMVRFDAILDELCLDNQLYASARLGALGRALAIDVAQRQGFTVTSETLRDSMDDFRRERQLFEPEDLERWMEHHELSADDFTRFMEGEARVRWAESAAAAELKTNLLDHLRAIGEYQRVLQRAKVKSEFLEARGVEDPSLLELGVTEDQLLRWHSDRQRAGSNGAHHRGDDEAFKRALRREYYYLRSLGHDGQGR